MIHVIKSTIEHSIYELTSKCSFKNVFRNVNVCVNRIIEIV